MQSRVIEPLEKINDLQDPEAAQVAINALNTENPYASILAEAPKGREEARQFQDVAMRLYERSSPQQETTQVYRTVLFVVLIVIFVATAVITLLGICEKISIKELYLKPLFGALIIQSVGVVVGLFRGAKFISTAKPKSKPIPRTK